MPCHGILRNYWESMGTERKSRERLEISIVGASFSWLQRLTAVQDYGMAMRILWPGAPVIVVEILKLSPVLKPEGQVVCR